MTAVALLVALSLGAAPASPAAKKLAMPALATVGLTPEFSRFASEHLAQELSSRGLSVTTDREIASLIGLERQKELMGCSADSTSCVAELAGALGVDALVLGDMGKFGDIYRVNLKIVSASTSEKLATSSFKASSENEVLDQLSEAAAQFAAKLRASGPAVTTFVENGAPAHHPYRSKAWIAAVVGVALAGFGTYEALQAKQAHDDLILGRVAGSTAGRQRADEGNRSQLLATVAFGAAGLSLAAAAAMFVLSGEQSGPTVSVSATGASVGIAGRF